MDMSDNFRKAMHEIIENTPYAIQMPGRGLNACLDDLVWFNENRGPGEMQENIKNKANRILRALGCADSGEGTANGSPINQNAINILRTLHPQSIRSVANNKLTILNYDVMSKPNDYINTMPDKAKYIWAVLSYIEGFTYLIPAAINGSYDDLNKAKVFFNNALIYCPEDKYIKEVLTRITDIENALTRHSNRRKGGCFIATAALGSPDSQEILTLYRWREDVLLKCCFGRIFVRMYYTVSPTIAKSIQRRLLARYILSKCIIRPWCRMIDKIWPETVGEHAPPVSNPTRHRDQEKL